MVERYILGDELGGFFSLVREDLKDLIGRSRSLLEIVESTVKYASKEGVKDLDSFRSEVETYFSYQLFVNYGWSEQGFFDKVDVGNISEILYRDVMLFSDAKA